MGDGEGVSLLGRGCFVEDNLLQTSDNYGYEDKGDTCYQWGHHNNIIIMLKLLSTNKYYKSLNIINPHHPLSKFTINTHTIQQIDKHRQHLTQARQSWMHLSPQLQSTIIDRFIANLHTNRQKLSQTVIQSTGKAKQEVDQQFELAIKVLHSQLNHQYPPIVQYQKGNFAKLYPYGNALNIYNHSLPILTPFKYLGVCLKSGNTLILDPDIQCVPSSLEIQRIWKQSTDIPMIYTHVSDSQMNTDHLIKCDETGFISFSGRLNNGMRLYHRLSENSDCFAQSQFLLGSCDAAYVAEDANLQQAAKCLGKGIFSHCGQLFCSIKRVYVHQDIAQQFIQLLVNQQSNYKPDDPMNSNTRLSCILLEHQYKQSLNQIAKLKESMQLLSGGTTVSINAANFILPTLFKMESISSDNFQNQEYNFPIAFISQVISPPIQQVNSSLMGNTFTIFTANQQSALYIGDSINVGVVNVNTWGIEPHLPYSPRKRSGKGYSFSALAYNNITRTKSISF